jgi:hypothetical protein
MVSPLWSPHMDGPANPCGLRQADATAGQGEIAKEPCVFPRHRPDISDAQAELYVLGHVHVWAHKHCRNRLYC